MSTHSTSWITGQAIIRSDATCSYSYAMISQVLTHFYLQCNFLCLEVKSFPLISNNRDRQPDNSIMVIIVLPNYGSNCLDLITAVLSTMVVSGIIEDVYYDGQAYKKHAAFLVSASVILKSTSSRFQRKSIILGALRFSNILNELSYEGKFAVLCIMHVQSDLLGPSKGVCSADHNHPDFDGSGILFFQGAHTQSRKKLSRNHHTVELDAQ